MASGSKSTFGHCPECGLQLTHPAQTGGLCPRCLIATAVEHLSTVDHPALGRFGALGARPDINKLNEELPAYEFIELLGRGGAGWVFRARQQSLNRSVAIKILHGTPSALSDAAQRFSREAQILARLKHPRVVTIHDFGTLPDAQYIVMEYLPGPTLRELLRSTALGNNALRVAIQICEAVEHAHSLGILHRDLKPENVLFESFDDLDSLKVADFGISRLIGDTEPGFHHTQTGFVVGTPFYAAPEQMAGTTPVDTRADIYSIGVMLYEMLAGQIPRGRFPPPSQYRKNPRGSDAVVLRCLENEPGRRYSNVAALRAALEDVLSGAARRRQLFKVALSLIVALPLVALAWQSLTGRTASDTPPLQADQQESRSSSVAPVKQAAPTPESAAPPPSPLSEKPRPAAARALPPETHQGAASQSPPPAKGEEPFPALPPPAKRQAAAPPSTPLRDEEFFQISSVRVYGFSPTSLDFRITGQQRVSNFAVAEGNSLVWVVQTNGAHRIDSPFKMGTHSSAVSIADHVSLDFGDAWPIEVFIAERWYTPTPGARRLSNVIVVNSSDVRADRPPKP